MNRSLSIYLDFLRIFSAILVFFSHARYPRFFGQRWKEIGAYGHDAVMFFFVMSGFLIAYSSGKKTGSLESFAKKRLARLYSVVFPALLLTLIFNSIGKHINPGMYTGWICDNSQPIIRYLVNLFFLNEIWFGSWRAFSNGPFWSISYWFWFYAVYAAAFYLHGPKRYLSVIVLFLIAGPKVFLLLPVWLTGVLTYRLINRINLNTFVSLFLCIFSLIIYFWLREMDMSKHLALFTKQVLGEESYLFTHIGWSKHFLNDYIVGVLIAAHVIGFASLFKQFDFPRLIEPPIRYLAGLSFTLYMLHYPLLMVFSSLSKNGNVIVVLVFLSVWLLSFLTEKRINTWEIIISFVFNLFGDFPKNFFFLKKLLFADR